MANKALAMRGSPAFWAGRVNWVRVRETLVSLAGTPRPKGCVKLSTGAWRIRVGEFWVLYDVDDKARAVEVLRIKHCRESYRGL